MKKGFTLIELLAVIVILAIIATIATPIVLDIIGGTKESSILVSAENYLKAVELSLMRKLTSTGETFKPTVCKVSNENLNCDGLSLKVITDGQKPSNGVITFIDGEISTVQLIYDNKTLVSNADGEIIKGTNYVEKPDLLNGTLVPVKYDGNNWIVVSENSSDWYNYKKQEWANAVILPSDVKKNVGDKVAVDGTEALAMYVWIPRFEYKIDGQYGRNGKSAQEPGEIDINFISRSVSLASNGYRVHSAFTFDNKELSGIWVAKFEISNSETTTSNIKQTDISCSTTDCEAANNLRILPDKISLRYTNVSSYWYAIKSMENAKDVFGIDPSVTDSHMIKNNEWGAVAYLSQSKYGKHGNNDYKEKNKEIYMNNSRFYTGRSSGSYGTNSTGTYNGTYAYDGYLLDGNTKTSTRDMKTIASTTGNITGIYDMSGGAHEYVMGVYINSSTNEAVLGQSGFITLPDEKYINKYEVKQDNLSGLLTACDNGVCYGHALTEVFIGELKRWYDDQAQIINNSFPWYGRGGYYKNDGEKNGPIVGVFSATRWVGGTAHEGVSTRSVLVPTTSNIINMNTNKTYTNGEIVYYDVLTGKKCDNYNEMNSITGYNGIDNVTGNQNSCLKFYAFNDDGGYTVNLILDHNTTSTSEWNSSGDSSQGPKEVIEQLNQDTSKWKGTVTPLNYTTGITERVYTVNYSDYTSRLISANEIAKIVGNNSYDENKSTNNSAFFFDSKINAQSSTCKSGDTSECRYGWLYDRTSLNCTVEGCLNNGDADIAGYWTISTSPLVSAAHTMCNGYVVQGVSSRGRLGFTCPNQLNHYGVRPVIEVFKLNL